MNLFYYNPTKGYKEKFAEYKYHVQKKIEEGKPYWSFSEDGYVTFAENPKLVWLGDIEIDKGISFQKAIENKVNYSMMLEAGIELEYGLPLLSDVSSNPDSDKMVMGVYSSNYKNIIDNNTYQKKNSL